MSNHLSADSLKHPGDDARLEAARRSPGRVPVPRPAQSLTQARLGHG